MSSIKNPTESLHDAYERGKLEERKRCHDIALAIDSGRGNEKMIAEAITNFDRTHDHNILRCSAFLQID